MKIDKNAENSYEQFYASYMNDLQTLGQGVNDDRGGEALVSLLRAKAEQSGGVLTEAALQETIAILDLHGFGSAHGSNYNALASEPDDRPDAEVLAAIFADQAVSSMIARNSGLISNFAQNELFGEGYEGEVSEEVMANIAMALADGVKAAAGSSGYHALTTLESEYSVRPGEKPTWSVLAVQPLYEDESLQHSVFMQVSHERQDERKTYNAGLGYRYMPDNELWLAGVNAFFDYQRPYSHKRFSLGADFQTSLLGAYANWYQGINDWTTSTFGYEERPLDGYDFMVSGRVPSLPNLQGFAKVYKWNQTEGEKDIFGKEFTAEYTPVPIFTIESFYRHENERDPGWGGSVRLNYVFGQSWDDLWDMDEAMRLTSMAERRYDKVRRTNEIRVQERVNPTFAARVVLNIGAGNTIAGVSAQLGQTVPLDVDINVAVGNFMRLEFGDGAILNISAAGVQAMSVRYDLGVITLTSGDGFIQYISNDGVARLINVPGGSITLSGTDIDVRANAGTTTIRVRDGGISVDPTQGSDVEAGTTGDIIRIVGATVDVLAPADADYIAHEQDAYTGLDTVPGVPVDTQNAAPYIMALPTLVSSPAGVGDDVDIKLIFNKPVNVTGPVRLDIDVGGDNTLHADIQSGSGTSELVFRYTLTGANGGASSAIVNAVDLNGGTVKGLDDKIALTTITSQTLNFAGMLASITAVSKPADGSYPQGSNLDFDVTFSEDVTINTGSGTPYIGLTFNTAASPPVQAAYQSQPTTNSLRFRYTTQAGDIDPDGIAFTAPSIILNGGTITTTVGGNNTPTDFTAVAPDLSGVEIGVFMPTDIANVKIWLDGQDINGDGTVPNNGDAITTWQDKANNNDATFNTSTYSAAEQAVQVAAAGGALFNGSEITTGIIFSVQQKVTGLDVNGRVLQAATGQGNYLFGNWGVNGHAIYINANPSQYNSGIVQPAENTNLKIYALEYPSANEVNFYAEGNLLLNDNTANPITGITWATNGLAWSSENTDHIFKEFIVVDTAINTADRQKLEGYLAHRWGLEANLPAAHPYKAAPP